jgi:hypothetical protein
MRCPVLVDSKVDIYYKWCRHLFICTKTEILVKASDIIVELFGFVWEARLSYIYRYSPVSFNACEQFFRKYGVSHLSCLGAL